MFRPMFAEYSANKTEFIKNEFETVCNDVIDIHPYADPSKGTSDVEGEIEPMPKPEALSSSSGFISNTMFASSAAEEQHTV